jgi:hypothetical protein
MAAGDLRLNFDAGTTWVKHLTWTDPDGTPIVWTGYSAAWEFSRESSFAAGNVFYTASGSALTLTSDGVMTLTIPDEVRDTWPARTPAFHHLNVTLPSGTVERWLAGRVVIDD